MEALERIIGYTFVNPAHLRQAMTHPSLRYEGASANQPHNQRLEFLGDAVVQLILSDTLFHRLDKSDEGGLTKLRANLVSTKALAKVARNIGLGQFIVMGRGEELNGGRNRDSTLADALEALFGAVYLDGSIETARVVANHLFKDVIEEQHAIVFVDDGNPKGQLQEIVQASSNHLPIYRIEQESGPDHDKSFLSNVSWDGHILGRGEGRSKREAEAAAARAAVQNPKLLEILSPTQPSL